MDLLFIKDDDDGNRYWIKQDGVVQYYLTFNRAYYTKNLYTAHNKFLGRTFDNTIELSRNDNGSEVETIVVDRKVFPYSVEYFEYNNSQYKAIVHFGTKKSIFRDSIQIAYYASDPGFDSVAFDMKLVCDHDAEKELLLLLCIRLYSDFKSESSTDGGNPTFNVIFQPMRFNKRWRPK